jgi:hypothetical protein
MLEGCLRKASIFLHHKYMILLCISIISYTHTEPTTNFHKDRRRKIKLSKLES